MRAAPLHTLASEAGSGRRGSSLELVLFGSFVAASATILND